MEIVADNKLLKNVLSSIAVVEGYLSYIYINLLCCREIVGKHVL